MTDIPSNALYPVLPLRDIVVFPHMIVPLFVGREKSVRALEDVMRDDKQILLVDAEETRRRTTPTTDDIYTVGTVGTVLQLLKLPRRHRQGPGRGRWTRAHRRVHRA